MRTFLIFLFVSVVSLFIYNPELDDFKRHIAQQERTSAVDQERTALTNRMFNADTTVADQEPAKGISTERNNYLLFSTYRIIQSDDFRTVEIGRYLGIATMFFELGSSENMTAHAAQP